MKVSLKFVMAALLAAATFAAHARTIEMQVNGLVCAFCAQGIEKQFRALPEASDVYVSLDDRIVAVELKPDADITDAELEKAITGAGFSLVGVKRTDRSLEQVRAAAKSSGD